MSGNPKVVGAFVLGFAMVAGAYVITNFGQTNTLPPETLTATAGEAPLAVSLAVTDNDGNGIEDWQDTFITTDPIVVDKEADYEPPSTVTGQFGIQYFETALRAKSQGAFGAPTDKIAASVMQAVTATTSDKLYNLEDAILIEDSSEAIRTYGNTMANIIVKNNIKGSDNEINIVKEALQDNNKEKLAELAPLANMYKALRDQSLNTPVPRSLIKTHLDLINVYNAIYNSLEGMQKSFSDPMVAFNRIQRYQDDANGLALALRNLYLALEPNGGVFLPGDPAVVINLFSPQYTGLRK